MHLQNSAKLLSWVQKLFTLTPIPGSPLIISLKGRDHLQSACTQYWVLFPCLQIGKIISLSHLICETNKKPPQGSQMQALLLALRSASKRNGLWETPLEGHSREERFVLYIWKNSFLVGKALSPHFSKQCSSHFLKWYLLHYKISRFHVLKCVYV